MSTRPITPAFVLPPNDGLGSNSNYIITSQSNQCGPITDLIVTINITQDIVLQSSSGFFNDGYSFQLNCCSPPNFVDAFQQYVFLVWQIDLLSTNIAIGVNNYKANQDQLVFDRTNVLSIPSTTLPAGYQLQFQLKTNAKNNVVAIRWIINDLGALPAPTTHLTGYWLPDPRANNNPQKLTEQHINYIGIDGHIHERLHFATGDWSCNDLSVLAGNRIFPTINSALASYTDASGGQHVNFIGTDDHVHQLYIPHLSSQWVDNDLTLLAKTRSTPVPATPLTGYVDTDGGQHVNYIGTDGHVHELYIAAGAGWIDNDLIMKSGNGVGPRRNSPLAAYIDDNDGQHVNFIGIDDHVHELYIAPHGTWVNNDLITKSNNSTPPSRTSSLCSYLAQDNGQHVDFIGVDGHVHELYIHPNAQWINNDLTQKAPNSTPPAPDSPLSGYWGSNNSQHVNFIGTDGHVHELYIPANGQWIDNDFTQKSGNGMTPAPNSALHSYAQPNGDQHVNFIGTSDAHLHELFFRDGQQWVNNDLNNLQLVNTLDELLDFRPDQFAPVCAVELNLVGPYDGDSATFSSGAGNFIYASATPLVVQDNLPPCAPLNWFGTGETSNSHYGELDAGPSNVITQSFYTSTTEPLIRSQAPAFINSKRPNIPGKTNPPAQPVPANTKS